MSLKYISSAFSLCLYLCALNQPAGYMPLCALNTNLYVHLISQQATILYNFFGWVVCISNFHFHFRHICSQNVLKCSPYSFSYRKSIQKQDHALYFRMCVESDRFRVRFSVVPSSKKFSQSIDNKMK